MEDAVEAAVVVADRFGEVVRGGLVECREVRRDDDRLRCRLGHYDVEYRFQLAARASEQHDVRAVARVGERSGAANAGAGARDQHDAPLEKIGLRAIACAHVRHRCHGKQSWNSSSRGKKKPPGTSCGLAFRCPTTKWNR